jgi:hypothetical protein
MLDHLSPAIAEAVFSAPLVSILTRDECHVTLKSTVTDSA